MNMARAKAEIRTKSGHDAVVFALRKAQRNKKEVRFEVFNELIGDYNDHKKIEEFQEKLPYRD